MAVVVLILEQLGSGSSYFFLLHLRFSFTVASSYSLTTTSPSPYPSFSSYSSTSSTLLFPLLPLSPPLLPLPPTPPPLPPNLFPLAPTLFPLLPHISNSKKHKKRRNKEYPPRLLPAKIEEKVGRAAMPQVLMNVDANSKSLEEENLKLKEQRLCKVQLLAGETKAETILSRSCVKSNWMREGASSGWYVRPLFGLS